MFESCLLCRCWKRYFECVKLLWELYVCYRECDFGVRSWVRVDDAGLPMGVVRGPGALWRGVRFF